MPYYRSNPKLIATLVSGAFLLGGLTACQRGASTPELLAEAKQYQAKGDYKAAIIQVKNAVEKSPDDGEARLQLAALYWETGDAVSAEKELRKARSLGIAADRVTPMLGKALMQGGKFKELLDEIKPEQATQSAELLTLRGNALLATGSAADAKQAFDQALALNPNDGDALLGLSRYALTQKDLEGAQRALADAVAKAPKNPDVWMANGAFLRSTGKPDEALAAYDEVLKLKPDHRGAHIEKAYVQIARGKFDEAKLEIDAAAKAAPNNLLVTYARGLYEFSQGNHAAAQEHVQKVLKSAPEHMPSVLLAGASGLQLGSIQQAEHHIRHYLESNPNDVYARKLLAQILLKSAQPADAALALEPALKNAVQDPQLMALAGEAHMQVRDFNKASSYFEKAAQLAPKAATVRTSLGLSKLAEGDRARGLSELELATTLDPKSIQATMALAQTEMSLGNHDKALAAIEAYEKQQKPSPQLQNIKGAVYMSKNDRANARAAFEKALSLQADYFQAAVNLARMDMQDRKPDAARSRFEKLLQIDKDNVDAMTALGELALAQQRKEEATSWFEKANNAKPDLVAPAMRLGAQYLQTNQAQKALALARKYATLNPANPDVLELLGHAQLANQDAAGAIDTYSKVVKLSPKAPRPHLRLAAAHLAAKDEAAAAADMKRALELDPNYLPALLGRVDLAIRAKRFDEALAYARDMQKLKEHAAIGHNIEGDIVLSQGKTAPAIEAYDKAFALNKSPELFIKSSRTMLVAGKVKEAKARITQWVQKNPNDVPASLLLSDIYLMEKAYKPAIASLEALQKRVPNNPLILNNLAWAYQKENDPRALETAEQAYKLASNNAGVVDTLGWILLEQGNASRALPLLQAAQKLAPNSPEISYHLAVGLNKSGDKQGARKELTKLLENNKNFPQQTEAQLLLKSL